jgi:hypothetical protein
LGEKYPKIWLFRGANLPTRPCLFILDQSDAQRDSCSGILNLAGCEARPRPSKKDGFCFKIFNLAQYPIYSKQGLKGETLRKALLPVGDDYCIMRVTDEKERSDWIDKIHQAIPEYERIKALGGTSFVDYDSDSDDDDDGFVSCSFCTLLCHALVCCLVAVVNLGVFCCFFFFFFPYIECIYF